MEAIAVVDAAFDLAAARPNQSGVLMPKIPEEGRSRNRPALFGRALPRRCDLTSFGAVTAADDDDVRTSTDGVLRWLMMSEVGVLRVFDAGVRESQLRLLSENDFAAMHE